MEQQRPLLRLPFSQMTVCSVVLLLGGLLSCLLLSLLLNYEQSTFTLCKQRTTQCVGTWCTTTRTKVPNYLPSISASVSQVPERYVWRVCVGLHAAPRYLTSAAYFALYRRSFPAGEGAATDGLRALAALNLACGVAETTAMLAVTYVSSLETYTVHEQASAALTVCSLLHTALTCFLWRAVAQRSRTPRHAASYRLKVALCVPNAAFCLAAVYLLLRHRRRCEAGVYTLFAAAQFLLAVSNTAFHATAFWDLGDQEVLVVAAAAPQPVVAVAATPGD